MESRTGWLPVWEQVGWSSKDAQGLRGSACEVRHRDFSVGSAGSVSVHRPRRPGFLTCLQHVCVPNSGIQAGFRSALQGRVAED